MKERERGRGGERERVCVCVNERGGSCGRIDQTAAERLQLHISQQSRAFIVKFCPKVTEDQLYSDLSSRCCRFSCSSWWWRLTGRAEHECWAVSLKKSDFILEGFKAYCLLINLWVENMIYIKFSKVWSMDSLIWQHDTLNMEFIIYLMNRGIIFSPWTAQIIYENVSTSKSTLQN